MAIVSSNTQICNLALSHLGNANEINNLETEKTAEAISCRRYYTIALGKILEDFNWPFSTKFADLALVEEDPTDEWSFSYRYPSDCLNFRRIPSGIRNDTRQSRIPYKIGQDDQGYLIFTDQSEAQAEYTVNVTDVTRFSSSFALALSYLLAFLITPRSSGSDRFNIGKQMYSLYEKEIENARLGALNEEQPDLEPESEFIRARDDGSEVPTTRFEPA